MSKNSFTFYMYVSLISLPLISVADAGQTRQLLMISISSRSHDAYAMLCDAIDTTE